MATTDPSSSRVSARRPGRLATTIDHGNVFSLPKYFLIARFHLDCVSSYIMIIRTRARFTQYAE